jgi:hypothetical protein
LSNAYRERASSGATDVAPLSEKLAAADIPFARVSDTGILASHPHLRRITVETPSGPVSYPAPPRGRSEGYGAVPGLGALRQDQGGIRPAILMRIQSTKANGRATDSSGLRSAATP